MVRRLLWALVAAALATGCTGVPSSGPARVVRRVPQEDAGPPEPRVIRRLPPNPPADARPDEIVRNFVIAQDDPLDDYAVARRYLAPTADWDADGRAIVYASREVRAPRETGTRATVVVRLRPVGDISVDGEFRPRAAPVDVTFRLRRVQNTGWRLVDPPAGLLLTRDGVAASFSRTTLYWPDQPRRLVPHPVFLRASDQPVTAIVRALLGGPRGWLAPAVRTAIPPGTELLGSPEIVDGVVTLRLSREVRGAEQETLGTLVAQVVWSLTERPEVRAVRVLAEDAPLNVPGRPGLRDHERDDWLDYAPVPPTADRRLFFVRAGAAVAYDEQGRPSRVARTEPLESFAVNRAGTRLAAVTRGDGQQSLLLVDLTGAKPARTVLTADSITVPTWEPGGDVVWAVQSTGPAQQIAAITFDDPLVDFVRVPPRVPQPITALRLSPDGARAVLVGGPPDEATLWVARVERPASGGRVLGEPRRLAPAVRGVTAVAFDGASHLLFAAGRSPSLYRTEIDGFTLDELPTAGLPPGAVAALAVSAGTPADRVAGSGGRLWRRSPGGVWAALSGGGRAPVFAG